LEQSKKELERGCVLSSGGQGNPRLHDLSIIPFRIDSLLLYCFMAIFIARTPRISNIGEFYDIDEFHKRYFTLILDLRRVS
jgi:hypothetical protein